MYNICIHFVIGYIWVCTVCAPFDLCNISVHTNIQIQEIRAHFFCQFFFHGAHFSIMSTLDAFCMHFMSKSVLIRSVHHYNAHLGQKCLIVLKVCTRRKQCQNKFLRVHTVHTVHTLRNFCVHFLWAHCAHHAHHEHTMQTMNTVHKWHWIMHWLTMLSFSRTPLVQTRWPQVASCVSKERRAATTQDFR